MTSNKRDWSIQDSIHTYQINRWGNGFFGIQKDGDLCVYPDKDSTAPCINIAHVIEEAKKEGVKFPAVIRFHDILKSQIRNLNISFASTIKEVKYQGKYFGVFPIKVNQLREVVEEISEVGKEFDYGLEAGSKTELLAALTYNNNQGALTILNGYKDEDYIGLAMLGLKLNRKMIIVIERFSEIHLVLKIAQDFNVEPIIGVRAKLASKASGKWASSSGDFAKFGLTPAEIVQLIELLKSKNKLHILKLFHFHVGSQIPDIRTIKDCLTEGARFYTSLIKMGAPLEYFDVGGGVGIDYDGSNSISSSSTNYTLQNYIGDVVYILKDICDSEGVAHPHIVTETGRAVAAHHSCVITNVFGNITLNKNETVDLDLSQTDHHCLKTMIELSRDLNHSNYQDIYNDAYTIKDEAISAFKLGVLNLSDRARVETLYWNICHQIINMTQMDEYVPNEIKNLKSTLADKYLCNFSLFQSAPDVWAIDQILPILPISNHTTAPDRECTIADITCDSDGKISNFLSPEGHKKTLKIHAPTTDRPYYIGLFLTGAYQDVMGDMHNLFGRLNEVHIYTDKDDASNFYIEKVVQGNSSADVLEIMQYNSVEMNKIVKTEIDKNVKNGKIKPRVGVRLSDFFESCLTSYTYLN